MVLTAQQGHQSAGNEDQPHRDKAERYGGVLHGAFCTMSPASLSQVRTILERLADLLCKFKLHFFATGMFYCPEIDFSLTNASEISIGDYQSGLKLHVVDLNGSPGIIFVVVRSHEMFPVDSDIQRVRRPAFHH